MQNLVLFSIFRHKVSSVKISKPILAVEEPEAHLHPHAQRRAFEELTTINAPVVLTTHSPLIAKQANPLGVVRLQSISDHETQSYQLVSQDIDGDTVEEFSKVLRGGRAEILFARSIVVVEGQTELIVLPELAKCLGYDLDAEGISLINAGGNRCSNILQVCRSDQLGIPAVVVYDTDTLADNAGVVWEAFKAGYIDRETFNSCRKDHPGVVGQRKAILNRIGWIGAETCFEEEISRHGYLDVVLDALDSLDQTYPLNSYLADKSLQKDAKGVAQFLKKRSNFKIPVAHAIASAVPQINCVPPAYETAIETAIALSDPELTCLLHPNRNMS